MATYLPIWKLSPILGAEYEQKIKLTNTSCYGTIPNYQRRLFCHHTGIQY